MAFKLLDDALNSVRRRLYIEITTAPSGPAKICIEICPESALDLDMLINEKTRSFERHSSAMIVDPEFQQILEKTFGSLLEDAKIKRNQLGIVFHESANYYASVEQVAKNLAYNADIMRDYGKIVDKIFLIGSEQEDPKTSAICFTFTAYMCHANPEIESAPGIVEM
jgi:hypothetical protein